VESQVAILAKLCPYVNTLNYFLNITRSLCFPISVSYIKAYAHVRLEVPMNMQRLVKSGIVLIVSTITSYIGAAIDHGKELGAPSIILGILGIPLGIWIVNKIDDYINI
jgi:hypothetical protein